MKNKYSILFVDDEEKITKYFVKIFENTFNIYTAKNITEALEILNNYHQDIAILITDQKMVGGSGVDLLSEAKHKYPEIIRIITTAYSSLEDSIRSIKESNVYNYITKPWNIEDIKNTVNDALIEFNSKKKLISMAGSIAHELRNPLSSISLSALSINADIKNTDIEALNILAKEELVKLIINQTKEVREHKKNLSKLINLANSIIDITLANLSGKKTTEADLVYLDSNKSIRDTLEIYPFKSGEEKLKVKVNLNDDASFIFKGLETTFCYILFNLIKNALYYLKDKPDLTMEIAKSNALGKEILQGNGNINNNLNLKAESRYNIIHIQDTGPGIPAEILSKLFGSFVTSGKKEGTGLGLDFCKRTMNSFGGDIDCESELNKWTRFNLYFPELSDDELEIAKEQINGHNGVITHNNKDVKNQFKILLVDDQQSTLIITKSYIEKALPYITCDIALSGFETIKMIKNNISNQSKGINDKENNNTNNHNHNSQYKLVLMDIDMPEMDGIETSKKIKELDKNIPIIADSSRDNRFDIKSNTSDYIHKPSSNHLLCRTINKWMFDVKDDFSYLGSEGEYLKYLKDKNILLADDQGMNRMMIAKMLEKYGLKIVEATDGKELLELYQKNQAEHKQDNSKALFDLILTDINMPPYNGDDATKQIRAIEQQNKKLDYNQHHNEHHYQNTNNQIPIIALSGDGMEQEIRHFFDCGINDYFIKGSDPESLIKIIAIYLKKNMSKANHNISDNVNNSADNTSNNNDQNHAQHYENQLDNSNLYPKTFNPEKIQDFEPEQQKMVISTFIASSSVALNKIRENKINNNSEELLLNLHSIKGSAGIIGAEVLYEYIFKIERKLKEIIGYNEKLFGSENINQNPNQSLDLKQNSIQNSNQKSALIPDLLFNQEWFLELEKLYAEMKREMEMI